MLSAHLSRDFAYFVLRLRTLGHWLHESVQLAFSCLMNRSNRKVPDPLMARADSASDITVIFSEAVPIPDKLFGGWSSTEPATGEIQAIADQVSSWGSSGPALASSCSSSFPGDRPPGTSV